MKFTKVCGSLAVAASILGMSGIAMADDYVCVDDTTLIGDLVATAFALRCETGVTPDGGWNPDNPIWRKGQTESCDIQNSLAKQLDEPRDETTEPPPYKGNKGKGNNVAAGAANDLFNGKVEDARLHLLNYIAGVNKANLSESFDPTADGAGGMDASYWSGKALHAGEEFLDCLDALYPPTL